MVAGRGRADRHARLATLVREISDYFYARAAPGLAINPHTKSRVSRLLEVVLAPRRRNRRDAERAAQSEVEILASMFWADRLMTEGGVPAAEAFGSHLAPTASVPGAVGAAVRASLKAALSTTRRPRKKTKTSADRRKDKGASRGDRRRRGGGGGGGGAAGAAADGAAGAAAGGASGAAAAGGSS